eukprot:158541_1
MATFVSIIGLFVIYVVNGNPFCPHLTYKGQGQRPKNTDDLKTYVGERHPSYCDRVVLGWSKLTPDPSLQVYQYHAITDQYIDESDHDLVYGFFTFNDINILSVSFNLGDFVKKDSKKQRAWDTIICSVKTALQQAEKEGQPEWKDIDIFFFGFQETDAPFKYNYLSKALKTYTEHSDSHVWKNVFKMLGPGKFAFRNTACYILYNAFTVFHQEAEDKTKPADEYPRVGGLISKINFKQNKAAKELMQTKTGIIIGNFRKIHYETAEFEHEATTRLRFRLFRSRKTHMVHKYSEQFVAFANAHLPIRTDQEDYGVEYRDMGMDALEHQFKNVYNAKEDAKQSNNLLVLIGDLNYRIVDGVEQLKTYLDGQKVVDGIFWHELDHRQFQPTCKRVIGSWNAWKGMKGEDTLDKIHKKKESMKKIVGRKKKESLRKISRFGTLAGDQPGLGAPGFGI